MTAFFDYMFVRTHEFYRKKGDIPIATGIMFLIGTQICILFTVATAFNFATGGMFSSQGMDEVTFKIIYGVIIGVIAIMDIKRYANSKVRTALQAKYKNKKSVPLWLIFMVPVLFLSMGLVLIFTLTTGK